MKPQSQPDVTDGPETPPAVRCSELVGPQRPCDLPCPKCGSVDIHREHRMPGSLDLGYDDRDTKRKNEYVTINGWATAKVIKECIMHHCRTCQYEWESGVWPNDQAHRSAPGGTVERNQEKQNE